MAELDLLLFEPRILSPEYRDTILRGTAESADWPKETLDLPARSPEELRLFLLNAGYSVEKFKTLPGFRALLVSGKYPWLADL